MDIEQLTCEQFTLAKEVEKSLSNLKKEVGRIRALSSEARSEVIKKKKTKLDADWATFSKRHAKISECANTEHDYFAKKFFTQTQELFNAYYKYLAELKGITEPDVATTVGSTLSETTTTTTTTEAGPALTITTNSVVSTPSVQETVQNVNQQMGPVPVRMNTIIKKQQLKIERMNKLVQDTFLQLGDDHPITYWEYKKNAINNLWDEIQQYQEDILVDDEIADMVCIDFMMIEEQLEQLMISLCKKLDQDKESHEKIALPKINIPTFEGDYQSWIAFHDLYVRMIHGNNKISKAEKMQFLKTSLKGEALKLLHHLPISNNNYDTAWDILVHRYDNKRILVWTHLENIFNLPKMTSPSSQDLKLIHDTFTESTRAIANLGFPTNTWGPLLYYVLEGKWDRETSRLFEQMTGRPKDVPEFEDALTFLETRFQSLEMKNSPKIVENSAAKNEFKGANKKHGNWSAKSYHTNARKCICCNESHSLHACKKFSDLTPDERFNMVKRESLCRKCLNHNNKTACLSQKMCGKCQKPHHTLLHFEKKSEGRATVANVTTNNNLAQVQLNSIEVLLATAMVKVRNYEHRWDCLRVLIDQGSQLSLISQDAADNLGLQKKRANVEVNGVGGAEGGVARSKISVEMTPRMSSNFKIKCELLVIKQVTSSSIPSSESDDKAIAKHLSNCLLADPTFNVPGPVDILLGADVIPFILKQGIQTPIKGCLAQNTEFGWVIYGKIQDNASSSHRSAMSMISVADGKQLNKFWEIEEGPSSPLLSEEDKQCQTEYQKTMLREEDGTYTVSLPFKGNLDDLGDTKKKATARLLQMEKKFKENPEFGDQYKSFMKEYEQLGHMALVPLSEEKKTKYHIPHQAVMKVDSSTTKLRVVFDASARSTTGKCLNQFMHIGPRLQEDLPQILLRWRKHAVVFAADIEKMYRQIKINNEHQIYQTILWRHSTSDPIREYRLTTVTYGTSSAPYLAIRTLQQLAADEKKHHPAASEVTMSDFYVDDMLSGCDTVTEAKYLRDELLEMLTKGGFNLRKWKTNVPGVLENVPEELQDKSYIELGVDETTKMLGVHWAPVSDIFKYRVQIQPNDKWTKRTILSQIARIYDPLGWLAPIVIKAKLLIQEMWLNESGWDEEVGEPISKKWIEFQNDLPIVQEFTIPRWIKYRHGRPFEIHGFCDASEKAYGAVVYGKVITGSGRIHVTLITAKSKVAPIKMRKTLPRLELCGAVLLSQLLRKVQEALKVEQITTFAWTDSMIALAWIKGKPERWNTFVGNRVCEIAQNTESAQWNHVKSEENPADLVSRGVRPTILKSCDLWWSGPHWLKAQRTSISPSTIHFETQEETKSKGAVTLHVTAQAESITERFSSFSRMIRVIAYCLKFVKKSRGLTTTDVLRTSDLQEASGAVIKNVQRAYFHEEIKALKSNHQLSKKSKLLPLHPFLDDNGVLRVGGRLQHSSLSYEEKHPAIIPHDDQLTNLIIKDAHLRTLHGGKQVTLALVRRKYWIVRAGSKVRELIRKCVRCERFNQRTGQQIMGNLPECRVNISPPFSHSGVDYAGPIQIRVSKGRGNKSYKGYVAVFICMVTKAIHLEAVSDMTTEAFIAAFKRFVSRRGQCAHIYSDNGTTFVGGNGILSRELETAMKKTDFLQSFASDGTQWHFGPPAAPHFGGLWEAGVKSMKFHLKRVIGDNTLTFEELTTVLCQIEACLNSRPLCVISDSNEFTMITPAHLVIGRAVLMQADGIDLDENVKITSRWSLIKKMKRDFWKIWSSDYLHQLQQRYKWNNAQANLKIGDVVLVKDDNLVPTKWPMARVTELHNGKDGKTRVVSVKTQNGTFKRPIVKLCQVPMEEAGDNDLDAAHTDTPARNSCVGTTNNTQFTRRQMSLRFLTYLMVMMFVNVCTHCDASSYTIKQPTSGLYVESLGDALLNRGLLRIDISINSSSLVQHDVIMNKTIGHITEVCNLGKSLSDEIRCDKLVQELETRHQDLQLNFNIITNGYGIRTKRGMLGQLLTSVFGVNDEVYADIANLDENQKQLIKSSKHQAAIMIKAVTTLNETENRITTKINHFTEKLNQGLQEIHQLEAWYKSVDINKINIHILYLHQLAHGLITEIESKYDKLLRVIHHQGHVIDFLTVREFRNLITNVTIQLSSQLQVITQRVVKMELSKTEGNVIVQCYFHLAENPTFTIINVTPIPQRVGNGTFAVLHVDNSLLAIDYNSQHYIELSRDEIAEADHLSDNKYLVNADVIHDMNTSPNCIIDTIYSRTSDNRTCKFQTFNVETSVWKHLFMQNTWMFITNEPLRVSLECNDQREDIWLRNTGIIQINQGCTLNTNKNILKTRISKHIQKVTAFHKPVPLDFESSPTIRQEDSLQLKEPVLEAHDAFSNLLLNEEKRYDNLTDISWATIKPHVTASGLSSLMTVIIIIAIAGTAWMVYTRLTRKQPGGPTFMLAPQDVQEGTV